MLASRRLLFGNAKPYLWMDLSMVLKRQKFAWSSFQLAALPEFFFKQGLRGPTHSRRFLFPPPLILEVSSDSLLLLKWSRSCRFHFVSTLKIRYDSAIFFLIFKPHTTSKRKPRFLFVPEMVLRQECLRHQKYVFFNETTPKPRA